jgi:lysozyme family protein
MFDTAVNFGLKGANQFLQEALGFSPDDQDGKVGPITRARLAASKPDEVANEIVKARINYRHQRVAEDPTQDAFLVGWLNRDNALAKKIHMC